MIVASVLRAKSDQVQTAFPWASVRAVLPRFSGPPRIGVLVVVNEHGRVMGALSERDVTRGLTEHGSALLDMSVESVMSRNVPICTPEDSLGSVMRAMTASKFRHLLVMRDGQLHGVVSIGDVVSARLKEIEMESAVLRDIVRARD